MPTRNEPTTAELLDAWNAIADLPPEAQAAAVATLAPRLRDRVQAMLDADPRADLPDLSDVWIGLRGLAQAPTATPPAPTHIAEFEVVRELGRGAQGVVYEAIQAAPRRRIAVKLLHPLPPDARRRLLDEAERLAGLEHPAFPYVVRAGETGGRAFIAMQLVPGVPLDVWARAVPPRRRLEAVLDLCEAIRFAHAQGTLHRDLKPSNVLVDDAGRVRVIDLGLAAATGAEAVTTAGTLAYMPPEREASAAGDVYAIAVLTWQVLTGALPYPVRGMSVRRATTTKLGPLPAMPELDGLRRDAVRDALTRALAPDPHHRTPSPDALAADLQRALRRRAPTAWIGAGLIAASLVAVAVSQWPAPSNLAAVEREAGLRVADGQEVQATSLLRSATRALGRDDGVAWVWLRHADRLSSNAERRVARVEAWLAASAPDLRRRAARALADELVARQDWDHREVLLSVATADDATPPEALAALRLARRSWAPDDPTLAAYARGTLLPVRGGSAGVDRDRLVVAGAGFSALDLTTLTVTRSATLAVGADAGVWPLTLAGTRYVVANDDTGRGSVWRWDDDLQLTATLGARALDVQADGDQAVIALGEPARGSVRFGALGLSPFLMPDIGADVQALLPLTAPGPAWLAAVGPWEGYLALTLDGDGRAQAHAPLSGSSRLARLGPSTFAAVTGPRYAPPSSRGAGVPTGLHLLELTPGRIDARVALPGPSAATWATRSLHTLDLDADGDTDLVAGLLLGDHVATWLLTQGPDGWSGAFIDHTLPLAMVPDPSGGPPGLVVRLSDRDSELWLLGRGEHSPPPVAPPSRPGLQSPRAQLLWAVGALPRLAAELCADGDPAAPATIDDLLSIPDEPSALAALRGAPDPLLRATSLGATIVGLLDEAGHLDEAAAVAARLGLPTGAPPIPASAWAWPNPAQVRLADGAPNLLGLGDDATLSALRFDAAGDFEAELDLQLRRMEGGAALEISLSRGDAPVATFLATAWGGRGEFHREFSCEGAEFPVHVPTTTTAGIDDVHPLSVRLAVRDGRAACEFLVAGARRSHVGGALTPIDQPWTLTIATRSHAEVVAAQIRATLTRATLAGATVQPATPGPEHRWVEGQLRAAHAALPPGLPRDILDVDLGRAPAGSALLAAPDHTLSRHFRRYPQAWLPWLSAALPPSRFQRVYMRAWDWTDPTLRDDEVIAAMLSPVPDGFSLDSRAACYFAWQRGRWLFSAGHFDRAAQVLLQLRDGCPGSQTHMDAGLTLTQALIASGREAEARAACATARAHAPVPLLFEIDVDRLGLTEVCAR